MKHRVLFLLCAGTLGACNDGNDTVVIPGIITVKIVNGANDTPAQGVDVVFSDVAGATLSQTRTDAGGIATFTPASSSDEIGITMMHDDPVKPAGKVLQSVMGARASDTVYFFRYSVNDDSDDDEAPTPAPVARLAITFPDNSPVDPDFGSFLIPVIGAGNCPVEFADSTLHYELFVPPGCVRPDGTVDVAVIAQEFVSVGENFTRKNVAYAFAANVPVSNAAVTPVTFPTAWRKDFAVFTLDYTNVPAGFDGARANFEANRGGEFLLSGGPSVPLGENGSVQFDYPKDMVTSIGISVGGIFSEPSEGGSFFSRSMTAIPDSASVDLTAELLPAITATALDQGVRPRVRWVAAGDLSRADAGYTGFSWEVNGATSFWDVEFPPTASAQLEFPALPDSLAAFRPPATGLSLATIEFSDYSSFPDYRTYLNRPLDYTFPEDLTVRITDRR
jgi:hypothetical protein